MATFQVSKPVNKDGLLLPAYFRQLFGCTWDIFYGLLVITSIILANWCAVDQNYYLLVLTMYIDFCIICDICMSMFIRFFQTVQVVAVNRNIEAVFIACRNIFGLWLDFTSCIPYISLMLTTTRLFCINAYTTVCLLRMGRLFTPRRMSLDQGKWSWIYHYLSKYIFFLCTLNCQFQHRYARKSLHRNPQENEPRTQHANVIEGIRKSNESRRKEWFEKTKNFVITLFSFNVKFVLHNFFCNISFMS